MPVLDDVSDQRWLIEELRQCLFVVVAALSPDVIETGGLTTWHGEHTRLDEEAIGDQLTRRRHDDQLVVLLAESAPIGAERCGCQADMERARIVRREVAIGGRERTMRLVDEHEIRDRLCAMAERVGRVPIVV